ncbi:hypothetical protein OG21DRAFT_1272943 [Imleria badia]|nr:hypothetical protein OG21DRAFT_1272943 [Imleria badia]
MFISPSSLALSTTLSAPGSIPGNIHSASAYPFPDLLPLSTPLVSPPNQSSTPPSSYTYFSLGSRSPPTSEFPSTMPLSAAVVYPYYLKGFDVINPSSQSSSSVSAPSDSLGTTTDTQTSAVHEFAPSVFACLHFVHSILDNICDNRQSDRCSKHINNCCFLNRNGDIYQLTLLFIYKPALYVNLYDHIFYSGSRRDYY